MGIVDKTFRLLGYGPLTVDAAVQAAVTGYRSPYGGASVLETATLEDLFGLAANLTVTRERAMKLAVVAKGRRVIAGNIGRLSLRTMADGKLAPVQLSLLSQPERSRPLSATLTWTADQLMFYPRTWWIVQERDAFGWPAWVKLLPQADAMLDTDGILVGAWGRPVQARDVIQFDAIDSGLLIDGAETIRRATILARAASLAEDNPVPALDIHNDGEDLDDDGIKELLDSWQAARRQRGVGYSSKGITVNALGAPVENLLIEGRKAIDLELARHIGAPAWAVDVEVPGASMTYQNRAARNWELIDISLSAPMTAISSRLSMPDVTPVGWTVEFATDTLTRDDQKTRFEAYKLGKDGGFITNEWIAAQEGWDTPAPTGAPA